MKTYSVGAVIGPILFVVFASLGKTKSTGLTIAEDPSMLWGLLGACVLQSLVIAYVLSSIGQRRVAVGGVAWALAAMGGYVATRLL